MASCELCGKGGDLVSAYIEGVRLKVCSTCSEYGKVIQEKFVKPVEKKDIKVEEVVDVVLDDYSNIVKKARETKGLSQKDLAYKLNEKESIIAKMEQGNIKPDLDLARKLERFLGIKLILKEKIAEPPVLQVKTSGLTIGDFLKKSS